MFKAIVTVQLAAIIALTGIGEAKHANDVCKQVVRMIPQVIETIKDRAIEEGQENAEQEEQAKQEEQTEQEEMETNQEDIEETYQWDGEVLTAFAGVANGPSGRESYYNFPMGGVIEIMRSLGYDEEDYPYWVRDDGVKMLGDYVMCAADLDIRPYGTILPSSLGMAIVCDTGTFALYDSYQLDIAVSW